MASLSALRQNTEVEARPQDGAPVVAPSAVVVPPSNVQQRTTNVDEADYLGIKKKAYVPPKTQGFFKSFVYGDDPFDDVEESTAGKVGDVVGSIFRIPAQKIANASLELWSDDIKQMRESIDKLRLTDPELAAKIEYESGFGARKTTGQNVTQLAAGIGEGLLTAIPIGLLGKAGRVAFAAKEAAFLSKFGKVGQIALQGIKPGASIGARVLHGSALGASYGGLYGFLAGLQEGGDWEKAFKNIPMYSAMGATVGGALPGIIGVAGRATGAVVDTGVNAAKATGNFFSKTAPDVIKPSTYFNKLPSSIQRAILTEGSYLRGKFGEVGQNVVTKFNTARQMMNKEIGIFQDEATRLGMLDAPATAKGAYKDSALLREKWKGNRDFRFAVRDALNHEGIFADPAVRADVLSKDKHMNDIVEFFDKFRKDRGLLAQQMGITDNLLDIEKYFSKYTPEVGLSSKNWKALSGATDDATREAIYASNSDVVDDMIEYGFRRGQWKTKAEGFKNYYDAMDSALNLGRVGDTENGYFQWLVENGHAANLSQARKMYIGDLDNMRRPLTQRAASLDYERKTPMPWSDPDPMRVMSYYVKKSDERIAMASQFGVNDEVLKDMQKAIATSNQGKSAADDFEKAIRSITGQVERAPAEQRFSAIVRGIETFHLAFSQIINVASQVNYLLATDMKHWAYGFKKAFEKEGMIESVRKGVFVSDMIRQTTPYSNFGDDVVDRILKYSGFSYTEMLNRATGIGVSESWAKYNFNNALAKMGKTVDPADEKAVITMFKDKKKAQSLILRKGYDNTGKYAREFSAKFPDEEFAPVAGNIGLAQKRLDKLEESIVPKIQKLQRTKDVLERNLIDEGKALTDENVMDLQETINILRSSIDSYTGGKVKAPAVAETFSDEQVKEALDGVVRLRRSKMEKMIEGLEEQFDEARALGTQEPTMSVARPVLSPEQKLAKINTQVQDIDEAILSLQNELTDKERLLTGIIDGYKIAETQIQKEFPEGFMYDKFVTEKKGTLGKIPESEAANLRELGIDPEEALARGALSEEDFITAAQQMVESTQGGNNPLSLPGMSRTPMGKIFYQFKSFAYMQAQFIQKSFVKDIVSKDTRSVYNAVKFITVVGGLYPLTYGALRDVRDIVTLKKSPEDAFELEEYFKGLAMFSAGGLFIDFMKSAQSGRSMEFLAGPTIGDVTRYLNAIGDITQGEAAGFKNLGRQLMNQTGVGNIINNTLLK